MAVLSGISDFSDPKSSLRLMWAKPNQTTTMHPRARIVTALE
jgi:hypothetical protein